MDWMISWRLNTCVGVEWTEYANDSFAISLESAGKQSSLILLIRRFIKIKYQLLMHRSSPKEWGSDRPFHHLMLCSMRLQICHLLLLCLAASLSGQSLDNTHSVLYGDRADLTALPVTSRVFLDRNGDLYPELPLSDSLLAESDASLAKLFIQRPDVFHTTQSSFAAYQDSVLAANLKVINEEAREVTDVIVLVHGFRKPFHPKPGGRTSRIEYLHLQQRIRNTAGGGSRPYFVEVYWDGTYDCCFGLKAKRNRDILNCLSSRRSRMLRLLDIDYDLCWQVFRLQDCT